MTRTKRGLRRAVLPGLIAATCWLIALFTAASLVRQYDGLSVRCSEAAITQKDLERAASASVDEELACTAAWTRKQELLAASSDLGGSAQVRVIEVYGDMRQAAPMKLLSGGFPAEDDTSGCLLDGSSAWALFHSTDAVGAEVTAGGKKYVVRGIVEAYEPMILLRKSAAIYENLEFSSGNLSEAKQFVETFLYRCGGSGSCIVVQSGLLARLALGFVWLPVCVFGALGAAALLKRAWASKADKRACVPLFIAGIALLAAAVSVLLSTFYWPQSFLPTKWSDFAFWSNLFEGWKTQWKAISLMTPLPKEIQLFQTLRRCGILLLTAFLAGGWCAASLRTPSGSSAIT